MRMRYVLALAIPLLAACGPTGQPYRETNAELIVYRLGSGGIMRKIPLTINHEDVCNLSDGGYYASQKTGPIEASLYDMAGKSRFVPKGKYVRATLDHSNMLVLSALGGYGTEVTKGGPVTFENVDAATAKRELADLKQDCTE